MKTSLIVMLLVLLFTSSKAQFLDSVYLGCTEATFQGSDQALEGGLYKPSSNAPGEYFRALIVYAQMSYDNTPVSNWLSGQLPTWANDISNSQPSTNYTSATLSDYFKKMSNGTFDFIADVYPDLITVPGFSTYTTYGMANQYVVQYLDNHIQDFSRYDNWSLENGHFVFHSANPDRYIDLIIVIYRNGSDVFGLSGGIANLNITNFTTHDGFTIGGGFGTYGSGITTNLKAKAISTPPTGFTVHLSHEFGHYLFGSDHAYFGLMTGKYGEYYGQTGAMNSWERKKLGYLSYIDATYNGINLNLDDYVSTGNALRVTWPFNTPTSDEYILVENHQRSSIYDLVIAGGSLNGDGTSNYNVGKGTYMWYVKGNNYPPEIHAITADGGWNWNLAGTINMDPNGWPPAMPLLGRDSKNIYLNSRVCDRNIRQIYWNGSYWDRWHDLNPLTKNWDLTREVMGDENDAFTVTGNNMITPWSNPSTTKLVNGSLIYSNYSIILTGQNNNIVSYQVYNDYNSALALPPSPPQNLRVSLSNQYATLTWEVNNEDDLRAGFIKIYSCGTSGGEPNNFTLLATINSFSGKIPITAWTDPTPIPGGSPYSKKFYKIAIVDNSGLESRMSNYDWVLYGSNIEKQSTEIKLSEYKLYQNYPNPFNPSTQIDYSIKEPGFVQIKIYDILGNNITTLENSYKEPGNYSINFDAGNISSGLYFYSINVNGFNEVKKMILSK